MKNFKTISSSKVFTAEYEIKKSVFISHVKILILYKNLFFGALTDEKF